MKPKASKKRKENHNLYIVNLPVVIFHNREQELGTHEPRHMVQHENIKIEVTIKKLVADQKNIPKMTNEWFRF